jgi:hypothetical protein
MKKSYMAVFTIVGIIAFFYLVACNAHRKEPVIIYASSLFEELSIDEKITRAELIVLGEVVLNLPSKWQYENDKRVRYASSQEIFNAEGLFTDSLIRTDRIIKGEFTDPLIRVRSFVGETGQLVWKNYGEPLYIKRKNYLLFLQRDTGLSTKVDPGNYISISGIYAIYEITDGKAVSVDDEWNLEELLAYIQNKLAESDAAPTLDETREPTDTLSVEQGAIATVTPAIDLRTFEVVEPASEKGPGYRVSPNFPDTPLAKKIIRAIERSYDVEVKAAYTLDFSKFPDVFINDSRYLMVPEGLELVRELSRNPSLESAGWLDYKMAYYSWIRDSILHSEAVHAKAKAENRALTPEERKSLIDPWGRVAPVRPKDSPRKVEVAYLSLEVNDDVAIVTLINGVYYSEVTLVLVDKKWYIAYVEHLSVSP